MSVTRFRSDRARVRHAFTLVELLVVIGIIAMLISILLPTLSSARQSANKLVCASNMRQVGQAAVFYANDNEGSLCYSFYQPPSGLAEDRYWWVDQFHHYLDESAGAFDSDRNQNNSLGSRSLFMCSEAPSQLTEPFWIKMTHYGTHPELFPEVQQYDGKDEKPYELVQIGNASEIGMVFEETLADWVGSGAFVPQWDVTRLFMIDGFARFGGELTLERAELEGINLGDSINLSNFGGLPNTDAADNVHTVRFRHGGDTTSNVLFADGHVSSVRYDNRRGPNDPQVTTLLKRNVYVRDNE